MMPDIRGVFLLFRFYASSASSPPLNARTGREVTGLFGARSDRERTRAAMNPRAYFLRDTYATADRGISIFMRGSLSRSTTLRDGGDHCLPTSQKDSDLRARKTIARLTTCFAETRLPSAVPF